MTSDIETDRDFTITPPDVGDGAAIRDLIERCPPLDLNSLYLYLLLADHFRDTCVVVRRGEKMVGFLSAYLLPSDRSTLFVWQVAVDETARGNGLAGRMLDELLARPAVAGATRLHTTVSPGNDASRGLFRSLAERHGATLTEETGYTKELFGADVHDDEPLLIVAPLKQTNHQ